MVKRIVKRIVFIPVALAALALFTFIVMQLWNHALAPATGWHELTYWQALGVLILAKILFGFGYGHGGGSWRYRMRKRLDQLTAEEREKIPQRTRTRAGGARETG